MVLMVAMVDLRRLDLVDLEGIEVLRELTEMVDLRHSTDQFKVDQVATLVSKMKSTSNMFLIHRNSDTIHQIPE